MTPGERLIKAAKEAKGLTQKEREYARAMAESILPVLDLKDLRAKAEDGVAFSPAIVLALLDENERLRTMVNFTLTDPQRLIRKEDVEGACQTPDMCFEHGGPARCWPCAARASAMRGVTVDDRLPKAPNEARLIRENERLRSALLRWRNRGCPDCGGDCHSANPPVTGCIMRDTLEALK